MFVACIFIAELREMLVNANKLFKITAFFDRWNQCEFLKILLQNFLAFINQAIATRNRVLLLPSSYHLLCELNWRLRELDVRVLVDQFFMKKAKSLVLLAHYPFFLVELYIDNVFSVLAIVDWIVINSCWFDSKWQRNLKEESPIEAIVFATSLNMLNKNLSREENLAEFTLHRLRMFKDSLK